jgi:Holliday junction resolvase
MLSLQAHADARHRLHQSHPTSNPLSPDYELVGMAGERELARVLQQAPDLALRPGGDGGSDHRVWIRTDQGERIVRVDVKTSRKPRNLLVGQGKVRADIYVQAGYFDASQHAVLLGWEWADRVRLAPLYRPKNRNNHAIAVNRLRPIVDLLDLIIWRTV